MNDEGRREYYKMLDYTTLQTYVSLIFFPENYIIEKISEISSAVFSYLINLIPYSSLPNNIHPFTGTAHITI